MTVITPTLPVCACGLVMQPYPLSDHLPQKPAAFRTPLQAGAHPVFREYKAKGFDPDSPLYACPNCDSLQPQEAAPEPYRVPRTLTPEDRTFAKTWRDRVRQWYTGRAAYPRPSFA